MKNKLSNHLLFLGICLFLHIPSYSQDNQLNKISSAFNNYTEQVYHEKLFLHTDKSFYTVGENIYFKAYLVDASTHRSSGLSKVIYIELIGRDTTIHMQTKISTVNNNGAGYVFLSSNLNSGNYQLRAYTRWMRNFSPSYYFQKTISVFNPFKPMRFQEVSEEQYDVQFFPEGGQMVNTITSKVGIRAVNSSGRSIEYKGYVLSNDQDTITTFSPLKFGLGSFLLTPEHGTQYSAHIYDTAGNLLIKKQLPPALKSGYVLSIQKENNQVQIKVRTDTTVDQSLPVYLMIHCRGRLIEKKSLTLQKKSASHLLSLNELGDGVNHITLFNSKGNPICERLFFKRPEENASINVSTESKTFSPRSKIDIQLTPKQITNAELSMAVYHLDKVQSPDKCNIVNYLLLNADLTGNIESPWYYFSKDSMAEKAVDNLMLTHGWRKFNWQEILTIDEWQMDFFPEYVAPIVTGKVLNRKTKAPASYKFVYLSRPGKNFEFRTAKSNKNGAVFFEMNEVYGSGNVYTQLAESADSLFEVALFNGYSDTCFFPPEPPLSISVSQKPDLEARSITMQLNHVYRNEEAQIEELDTTHFYGQPDERYYLDDYTRFPVMEEVFREYIRGVNVSKTDGHFQLKAFNLNDGHLFSGSPLVLLDGLPIFKMDKIMALDPLLVEQIHVKRRREFFGPMNFYGIISMLSYEGQLAEQLIDEDMFTLSFDGLQQQRTYFTPKYDTKEKLNSRIPDFRELLYWDPNITIEGSNSQQISFYASDTQGTYHVLISGLSSEGNLLHEEMIIKIKE